MGYFKSRRIGMMVKAAFTVWFSGFLFSCVHCQTLEEFTKQKQLQSDYKVDQIIALKAYSDVAKKGYEIAGLGLNMVREIQNGEFSLHRENFGSLSRVHPLVSEYPVAGNIVLIYRQINREVGWMQNFLNGSKGLGASELAIVNSFNESTLRNSDLILYELEALLSSDHYEMNDGERLAAIGGLEDAILGLLKGVRVYHEKLRFLELGRSSRQNQMEMLKDLYDVR